MGWGMDWGMDWGENLPILMFAALGVFLFSGYPVAFVLGGIGLGFGLLGMALGEFHFIQFSSVPSRVFGGIMENLILTAVPMFILMGTMLERSGIARDLLNCLQVLLRAVPGGLALAVTLMGTILAATTGIIGASVVMMSLLALPVMLARSYSAPLATGTIAASGTLGILIPPSIMLVIMADLLGRSVGNMFVAAIFPGLLLAGLYMVYIVVLCTLKPRLAPPLPTGIGPQTVAGKLNLVVRSFVPPVLLVTLVLGSILFGWATPTEAAGVGAFGAVVLAFFNLVVLPSLGVQEIHFEGEAKATLDRTIANGGFTGDMRNFVAVTASVVERAALTNAMIFALFIGATIFSFVFRALGGDDLVIGIVDSMGLGSWGLLILIMAIVFILGFFFDWIEITLIVLPVFSPVIALLDFGDHVA
ncbi:MAG TPA: TRAP transporter large permease subunit, partial [Aestuariivirgaceae bacterium]|nr:TRAP transporter large permease subunit [Aestuariivirgaceae bacterium]